MPFSQSRQISAIVGYAELLQPETVLDVGTGMGQYGFLLRTNLENINLFEIEGKHGRQRSRDGWRVKIDGIEGFAGYLTPVHQYAYNQVIVGDAIAELSKLQTRSYDLVLAIDILEHFEKQDGWRFLDECSRVAKRALLVSTPKEFIVQEVEANPLEDHRSLWSREDFVGHGFQRFLPDNESWISIREV